MAHKKSEGTSKDVFTLTLPLCCDIWQRDRLDRLFQRYNNLKNNLIADRRKALAQMERTRLWKETQVALKKLYPQQESLEKQVEALSDGNAITREQKKKLRDLEKQLKAVRSQMRKRLKDRNALLKEYGFSDYAFQAKAIRWQRHYKLHSAVSQKTATSVWRKFAKYLFGNGEHLDFSPVDRFCSIEGKRNETGITFRANSNRYAVIVDKMTIPVKHNKRDKYGYEQTAFRCPVHFCKIVRRPGKKGWIYFVQLVLGGVPPTKVKPESGEVLHPLGRGRVGNDIGPQTLAVVSQEAAKLFVLAERVEDINARLRRINRAMDRSRRSTNPEMFYADGRVVPINKLPEECLNARGKRNWKESARYKALKLERRYLYSKVTLARRQQHHELANYLLSLGDIHYIEDMNFKSLARKSKETKKTTSRKFKSRKRFGRSISNKAPATFVNIYETKVKQAGGQFYKIKTAAAKASQYNHQTKAYKKKQLSQRWNTMPDGAKVQRDLYSAFLIQNTNATLDGFEQSLLEAGYERFKEMHDTEIENLKRKSTPASTGVRRTA